MSAQVGDDVDLGGSQTQSRSRFNAVTHGLTAKTPVLPGESQEDFQARIDKYRNGMQVRNGLEEELADRAALAAWQSDRVARAQVARLTRNILTEPAMIAFREKRRAAQLGQRLFFDRCGPAEIYPARDYLNETQPRTSAADVADDPDAPHLIVMELETFPAGCQWLRERWGELRGMLGIGLGWQSPEKLKVTRLMGRQPMNLLDVPEVREVFLACHVLEAQFAVAFQELRCEVSECRFSRIQKSLSRRNLAEITPANATAARAVLLRIVDDAVGRLRVIEARHQRVADVVDPLQTDELSVDESKSGLQISRLQVSLDRLIHRNLDAIHKFRRNEADGWGRTRQERAQRKQEGSGRSQGDHRLVVDANGSVRNAEGYDGNLDEGLARYAAEFGRRAGVSADAMRELAAVEVRGVSDLARGVAPAVDVVEPVACFEALAVGFEPKEVEPLLVREQGDGANIKNEIVGVGQSEADVVEPEPSFEVADVSAEANEGEPLLVVEQGDGANIKNEIVGVEQSEAEGARDSFNTEGAESRVCRRDDHVERVAGGKPLTPLSRREKKKLRREKVREEFARLRGGQQKMDQAIVDELVNGIKWVSSRSA